jgi:hypothetical protein
MFWQWRERDWLVWAGWTATYAMGWFGSITIFLASAMLYADSLVQDASAPSPSNSAGLTLVLAVIWSLVGVGQWALMFVYFHRPLWRVPWWAFTYVTGWSILWLLADAQITGLVIPQSRLPVIWVLGSAGVAFLQWLVFRRYPLTHANYWLVIYPTALVATLLICWGLDRGLQQIDATVASRAFNVVVLPGMLFGAMTGLVLIDLCRHTSQKSNEHTQS